MTPLAPGRLSTTTGTLSARPSGSAMKRAMRSGGPPTAWATTMWTGRAGQGASAASTGGATVRRENSSPTMRAAGARSFCKLPICNLIARLDIVVLDDLGPARNFLAHERIEFRGRAALHLHALRR